MGPFFRASRPERALWAALLLFPLACRGAPREVETGFEPAPEPLAQEPWEPVASFRNPFLSEKAQRAEQLLFDTLDQEGIQGIGAGSYGFTLSVRASKAARAREIIAATIEEYGLEAAVLPAD